MAEKEEERLTKSQRGVHEVLSHYGFYQSGSDKFRQMMLDTADYVEVERGQPVMRSGEACDVVLFVGDGRVRVFIEGESGRVANLYHVHSGECCPINIGASLTGVHACASGVADSCVKAAAVPATRFDALRAESDELRDWIFDATACRYGEVVSLLRDVITLTVDQRLAEYLLKRLAGDEPNGSMLNITHANLAMDIGTAREVINRRLKILQSTGVVKLGRGTITITDQTVLASIRDGGD